MTPQTTAVKLDGKDYVIVPRKDYDRMTKLAKAAEMPPLPKADEHGRYPAAEYARVTLARDIIRERINIGLSQKELAEAAGIRVETLCRIETGKHTASQRTVDKIMRVIEAERRRHPKKGR